MDLSMRHKVLKNMQKKYISKRYLRNLIYLVILLNLILMKKDQLIKHFLEDY